MSRLRADRLLVSLAPDSVALARVSGMVRPRLVAKNALECDPAYGAAPWQGAIEALRAALQPLANERLDLTVVLSNRFVRYAIVPFEAAVSGHEEELALARYHFVRVHGERAKSWDLRLGAERHGTARLASAVNAGLIDAIGGVLPREGRIRLVSVQPYLMAAYNLCRDALGKEAAWLALPEHGRACLALVSREGWRSVQAPRTDSDRASGWVATIERECLRLGDAAPRAVLVHGPVPAAEEAPQWKISALPLPALEGYFPLEDGRYAMALSAQ